MLRIIQGQLIDCPLNETGQAQAYAVAERLAGLAPDRIYVSTLLRARQTAEAICAHHPDVPVVLHPDLMEMSFGDLEGGAYTGENEAFFGWLYKRWEAGVFSDRISGGESLADVRDRAVRVVETIVNDAAGKRVLVVTHGRWLRILLATILDGYRLEDMEGLLHRNTAISHLRYADGRYEAQFLACDRHLEAVS